MTDMDTLFKKKKLILLLLLTAFVVTTVVFSFYSPVIPGNETVKREEPIIAVVDDAAIVKEKEMPRYGIGLDEDWQRLIFELCEMNDLSYEMVLGFFHLESEGFKLDLISYNRDRSGRVTSYDSGIAQINSRYLEEYRQHAIKYCGLDENSRFDPLNPEHGIRAGIGGLLYYRDYWKSKKVDNEEELFSYSVNSYNMGTESYKKYVLATGETSRSYDRQILHRKSLLESGQELK